MAKLYTNEMKYSGFNDNFNHKLVIFHDTCRKANVPDSSKLEAMTLMLRELALSFYYSNISGKERSFHHACKTIKASFEGPEYEQNIETME